MHLPLLSSVLCTLLKMLKTIIIHVVANKKLGKIQMIYHYSYSGSPNLLHYNWQLTMLNAHKNRNALSTVSI